MKNQDLNDSFIAQVQKQYLNFLIDLSFQGVNRLSIFEQKDSKNCAHLV